MKNFLAWKKFSPQIFWLEKNFCLKFLGLKKKFCLIKNFSPQVVRQFYLRNWVKVCWGNELGSNLSLSIFLSSSKQPQCLPSNSVSNFPYVSQFLGLWKNFWLEKNFSPQIFWLEKNFRLKFLGLKKKFYLDKNFSPQVARQFYHRNWVMVWWENELGSTLSLRIILSASKQAQR